MIANKNKPDVRVLRPPAEHPEVNIYWDEDFSALFQPDARHLFGVHKVPRTKRIKRMRSYYVYRKLPA